MVVIGSPVRNRAFILPRYLEALKNIDYPDKFYMFLENDSSDNSLEILQKFPCNVLKSIKTQDKCAGSARNEYNFDGYSHLADIRNKFIDMVLETSANYLLSVDSDIIVPPNILTELLKYANENTIVGAAISNIPNTNLDGSTPGNFMIKSNNCIIHPNYYPLTDVHEVDIIGAVYLIPRKVLESGVRYAKHQQGEDIPFCIGAKEKGFKLLVNMDIKPQHIMTKGES